jgi:DUF4097 and DUF4098 domain-containing protein YvlB
MMKKLVTVILTVMFAAAVQAEEVNRSIDAATSGHVDISNIAGSITVSGWNRSLVEVTGTLGRNVEELIVERDGDKVRIKVKVPRNSGRSIDSDLMIRVPEKSSIDVGTVSADIDVTDVRGSQSLRTVSGDVTTEFVGGRLRAESVSGDVNVSGNNADGDVTATTVSGDVTLFRVSGETHVEAVSGDLTIDEGSFDRAELETVNGEIQFLANLRRNGRLSIDTVNGDLEIDFRGELSATFDVDTFNGSIRNCFGPKPVRTSKYTPGLELEFTEGGGSARVVISTLNGDVNICKK